MNTTTMRRSEEGKMLAIAVGRRLWSVYHGLWLLATLSLRREEVDFVIFGLDPKIDVSVMVMDHLIFQI